MGTASRLETPVPVPVPRLWQATQRSVGTLRDSPQPLPQHSLRVQEDRTQLPGYDALGGGWGGPGQKDVSSPPFGDLLFSHSPPSESCYLDGTASSPIPLPCDPPKLPSSLYQHAQACPTSRLRVTALTPGSPPKGRAHVSPNWTRTPRQLLPSCLPLAPVLQGCVGASGWAPGLGSFWEPLAEVSLSQHLPAPLHPLDSPVPLVPARTATSPSVKSPQAVTPWGDPVIAHLGVIEVANLAQVFSRHHPQPDGQALAQQPQDGGPQQHPQELGEERARQQGLGTRYELSAQGSQLPAAVNQPGDTGKEKPGGDSSYLQPKQGWPSHTPGCPPPVPKEGPPPFPSHSLGWGSWFAMGLGSRWCRRGYETPHCFLTRGLGGPGLTLNPATAPHCRSDSTLPGSR